MADNFWGLDRGQYYTDIVEQATTPAKDVELAIDLAKGLTRDEVLIALEQIKIAINKDVWPPA